MGSSLAKLKELTDNLPPSPQLGDLVKLWGGQIGQPHQEIKIEDGDYQSFALFNSPEISVARSFVSKGVEFPEHIHNEREYVLIYSGSVMVRQGSEKERLLEAGEVMIFEPSTLHYTRTLEDTWFISMTIPFSKDYPKL